MHHANNVVIMQMSQLGQIEALEDRVCDLKSKPEAQDMLISNLVSDNLDHLQSNMVLTQHLNRFEVEQLNTNHWLWNLESVVKNLHHIVGAETDTDLGSLGPSTLESGGDGKEGLVGGGDSEDIGAVILESMRPLTPAPRRMGLIKEMEEEAREAGLGG